LIDLLATAAQGQPSDGFDWGVLAVPVVAGLGAIAVAIYNTRGETASLRRLKAMNDVIEKLPKDSEVLATFSAARDVLAQRVSVKLSGPRLWKKIPAWGFGVAGGAVMATGLVIAMLIAPPAIPPFPLLWSTLISSVAVGVMTWSLVGSILTGREARRRVEAAKKAHPSRGQG